MNWDKIYILSLVCVDVVRKISNIFGRVYKDGCFDLVECVGGDGRGGGVDVGVSIWFIVDGVVYDLIILGVVN